MDEKEAATERTVPVALRFEASPALQSSLNELLVPQRRQLGDAALYLYVAGNHELPVIYSGIDGTDDSNGAKQAVERYNLSLSRPISGTRTLLYYRQFPVAGIDHFSSEDGSQVEFAIRLRTSTKEMNRLRQEPFDERIGKELILPYRRPRGDMQALSKRIMAYSALRRALSGSGLYVTHPVAMTLPPYVDQYTRD